MAKKNSSVPGQMDLLEVGPENLEQITPHLRKYKAAMKDRLAALKIEIKQKQIILDLIQQAELQPLPNGHIKFQCEGLEIDLEPRDVVIHVKEVKPKKKRGRPPKNASQGKTESKPDQGIPTKKEQKRKKRTVKSMQQTVAETEGAEANNQ